MQGLDGVAQKHSKIGAGQTEDTNIGILFCQMRQFVRSICGAFRETNLLVTRNRQTIQRKCIDVGGQGARPLENMVDIYYKLLVLKLIIPLDAWTLTLGRPVQVRSPLPPHRSFLCGFGRRGRENEGFSVDCSFKHSIWVFGIRLRPFRGARVSTLSIFLNFLKPKNGVSRLL
jgi:hypothetical protein